MDSLDFRPQISDFRFEMFDVLTTDYSDYPDIFLPLMASMSVHSPGAGGNFLRRSPLDTNCIAISKLNTSRLVVIRAISGLPESAVIHESTKSIY